MNFQEALKKLTEGYKIRRTCWEPEHLWKYDNGIKNSIGEVPNINAKQIKAEDWEITKRLFPSFVVIKEKKLTLSDKILNSWELDDEHNIKYLSTSSVKEFIKDINGFIFISMGNNLSTREKILMFIEKEAGEKLI